jgi:hypothetical protein
MNPAVPEFEGEQKASTNGTSNRLQEARLTLIGTEEEDLGLAEQVDDGALDTRRLARQEEVEDRIDVVSEARLGVGTERGQDGSFGSSLGYVLVLQRLSRGQTVVLVKELSGVRVVLLLASRLNDSNSSSSDVSESDVESSEVGSNDEEETVRRLGVLDRREELGVKSERQGELGGLVEVGLEDVLVEDEEGLEDLDVVRVRDRLSDLGVKLLIRQRLLRLESEVAERWHELERLVVLGVVRHGEVEIQVPDELGMGLDDILDRVARERLVSESSLDVVEDLRVDRVGLVEDRLEGNVARSESVAEVLGKDPSDVGVGGFLDGVTIAGTVGRAEEDLVGKSVQERSLLDDLQQRWAATRIEGGQSESKRSRNLWPAHLVDRSLDGRSLRVGSVLEVEADDGRSVAEVLDVLSGRVERVVVVELGEGAEEVSSASHLIRRSAGQFP